MFAMSSSAERYETGLVIHVHHYPPGSSIARPMKDRTIPSATLGDPMRPLIWVSKSRLATELTGMGHPALCAR
jgi:hypothetical protein